MAIATNFTYSATRVQPTGLRRADQAGLGMIAPPKMQRSSEEKLTLLRQLDRWRSWRSLDDRRLCLGCGRIISGHEIDATAGETGELDSVHCPTPGCQSIPFDWILPDSRDRELQT